jgi:hypothetical protein
MECPHGRTGRCSACYMREFRSRPDRAEKHRAEAKAYVEAHREAVKAAARRRYTPRPRPTLGQRFWSKVPKTDGCWIWTGAFTGAPSSGSRYGEISVEGRPQRAHRVAWFLSHGEWPAGHVLHACDMPSCVRPSHLFLGSQADNMQDAALKGRTRNQYG